MDGLQARAERLARLRDRFVAVNLRSRSVRLLRPQASGAVDLARLLGDGAEALAALLGGLGRGDATLDLTPMAGALGQDVGVLARRAHEAWAVTGADDLAVGWPFIEGCSADGVWIRGPLLLTPATLTAERVGLHRWVLRLAGPPVLNEALAQVLARLFGVGISLDDLLGADDDRVLAPDDGTWQGLVACLSGLGLPLEPSQGGLPPLEPLLPRLREDREVARRGSTTLCHHVVLGRFPAAASAIVGDYDQLVAEPPTDARLGLAAELLRADEAGAAAPALPRPVPGLRRTLVLESDTSQDEVLRWVEDGGRGLVVQGPPGTGKSQLISNLLAGCVGAGLRALLVCQKRAALDVVAERLAAVGLGEPVALVHDVVRDRGAVMAGIASSLERTVPAAGVAADDPFARLAGRVAVADEAWAAVAGPIGGRPPLAVLDERALDDDGRPVPDLDDVAGEATWRELEALGPRVDAWAGESVPLARPHGLWVRDDFGGASDADLARSFELVAAVHGELSRVRGGVLTPDRLRAARDALDPDLLETLASPDAARFALFWGWCGGGERDGEWRSLTARLERAKRELRPAPRELVLSTGRDLRTWKEQLDELAVLQGRWYRAVIPRFWRLRATPARIHAICSSWQGRLSTDGPVRALTVSTADLLDRALGWQELIAEMPLDHPFVEFGFQGDVEDVDHALQGIARLARLVGAVHRLHEALRGEGPPYDQLPLAGGGGDDPFCSALLADAAKLAAVDRATALVEAADGADAGLRRACKEAIAAVSAGGESALGPILDAAADAPRARAVDALLAGAPLWVRRFLRLWRPGGCPSDDLRLALERSWRRLALAGRPRSVVEAPLVDPDARRALAAAVAACRERAHEEALASWRARLAAALADVGQGPALRRIGDEARRQRRRLTLRQLVSRGFTTTMAVVRPLWLCSPETVSALFPLEPGLFDLVIFDEASQCPVEAGLPVLVRGARALVAGDEQQMPPSHFFEAADQDPDEDEALLASESMLSLGRVAFRQTMLQWHYRSRREELIAFSNRVFYGGRLRTAPGLSGGGASWEGLHWHRVDGTWEEQTNRAEADAVATLLDTLLRERREDGQPVSIGVVAFNLRQADLVSERIEARAAEDPAFAELLSRDDARPPLEQLFVRNLENVQGDERDVIVFTVAYGPSATGRVAARFGPLGQEGGEKRLNVAITRARRAIHVVTSMDPAALDVSGARNAGPRVLSAWLRFVEATASGRADRVEACLDEAASLVSGASTSEGAGEAPRPGHMVRAALAAALRREGLEVQERVGLSVGRLDLAVRRAGPWRVGVDCGAYLAEPDALARDVYGPRLWERLGWRILRVTPGQWLGAPSEVVARVLEAVD
ncbi:MAG: hypothetical protein AMXMBFR64_03460 [Myxococcales bacterium]